MILQRLLGRGAKKRPGVISPGQVAYAVGDIHGRLDLLDAILELIQADAARHADLRRHLIFLGDYVDRGPESRGVVDRLLQDPLPDFETIRLMGNHEQALLAFLDGESDGGDWLAFGGLETLMSYGVPLRRMPRGEAAVLDLRLSLAAALPQSHVKFFRECDLLCGIGDYVFVHAGVRPGIALESQAPIDLMWIRDDFLRAKVAVPGKVVVHGHTICDLPQDRDYRVNIDTGAFASSRLTALVLRGNERRFISTLDGIS